jgi:hypothetical protein
MMPGRVALTLMILAGLSGFKAAAQTVLDVGRVYDCSYWPLVPKDEKGTLRRIFPYPIGFERDSLNPQKRRRGTAEIPGSAGLEVKGIFVTEKPVIVGMLSRPNSDEPTDRFILPAGEMIEFHPDDAPVNAFGVRSGAFHEFVHRPINLSSPAYFGVLCARGDSNAHLENVDDFDRSRSGTLSRGRVPASPPLAEAVPAPDDSKSRGWFGDFWRPADPDAGSLDRLFKEIKPSPKALPGPGIAEEFTPKPGLRAGIDPATPSPKLGAIVPGPPLAIGKKDTLTEAMAPPASDAAPHAKETTAPPALACDIATGSPIQTPRDVRLASLQTVGARSASTSAKGFDYVVGETLPLDKEVDIADSARKIVPYEAVAVTRGAAAKLYVSLAGADETRIKVKEAPAAKPARTLRIVVVSGAAELAFSGLEQIDASLKGGGGGIGLEIAWHVVDEHGALALAGQYPSFTALVRAAADKGLERPDVLDEAALLALLDNFEVLLKSRTADKVFWIKGAYAIPSSIPQRFDRFLASVSDSDAIPHSPAGRPSKWLQIVSARTVGFSLAYLKEPVNSRQVGDVMEEVAGAVSGPRRLINAEDATVMAANLKSVLILSGATVKAAGDAPKDQSVPSGKLVLDASEVFVERGYVLSADAARELQAHLQDVQRLWDGRAIKAEVLAEFAGRTEKQRPMMLDILQMVDGKAYPRLPRTVADWARKPVKDLGAEDSEKARAFVASYAAGTARLVDKLQKAAPSSDSNCSLFYVSEENLGVEKR